MSLRLTTGESGKGEGRGGSKGEIMGAVSGRSAEWETGKRKAKTPSRGMITVAFYSSLTQAIRKCPRRDKN